MAQGQLTSYNSTALVSSGVISSGPCTLFGVSGRLDSTLASGTYYVQFYDSASVPADGAVTFVSGLAPIKIIHASGADDFFESQTSQSDQAAGVRCKNGLSFALSSTEFTKTLSSNNQLSINADITKP